MYLPSTASNAPRKVLALLTALLTALGPCVAPAYAASPGKTATPIQHLVVIFQENISFDHYFGTYPIATNPSGEPAFHARPGTPTVNGYTPALLNNNPNLNPANGTGATNPFRLDPSQAVTSDQDHDYTPEQQAYDMGAMDLFPLYVGTPGPPPPGGGVLSTNGLNLGYFDGNTVTAIWNYAQQYAMNDNFFGTTFGPSTPGALNLISGQTNGVIATLNGTGDEVDGGNGTLTVVGDPDPLNDTCSSSTRNQVQMGGQNIGDLLNAAGITWGSFMGGFNLKTLNPNGTTGCNRTSTGLAGTTNDYIPHHAWFQYYASTANPNHTRPASISEIGQNGPANHEYDLQDFYTALSAGILPAVSIIKAQAYQDGHAGYSDPIDEQHFLVKLINTIQASPEWGTTAIIIMYDDSDGWYDHQMGPIVNQSTGTADALTGPGACGTAANSLPGYLSSNPHALGRCGYGPRQPFLVISPWALENFVDHTVADQSSILRFIEDNWLGGQRIQGSFDAIASPITQMFNFTRSADSATRTLILNPNTGQPVR
ncbi:MAG TPA: alkaline phosphatase family protein [Terriglobales bacterium]|nr:alkaline phosphatase family protein [Terriglobales bacterium]